jgi:SAM-dependent methyltransferase
VNLRRATPANFDRVARFYRWIEYLSFGKALEHCRNHFLPQLTHCHAALVLGDGDGRFLIRLLSTNPAVHADAVDASSAMLRLLTQRAQSIVPNSNERLHTYQTDALLFAPSRSYDLIVTHFFLDCLAQSELNALAQRLAQHTTQQTLWLVSEFRIPEGRMHWPARAIVRVLYLAFRLLTGLHTSRLPDHAAALTAAGFHRQAQHLSVAGLLVTELWTYTTTGPALAYNMDGL